MVKLTPELIEQCAQYTNPVRARELDMRGYKIPVIENVGATLDQFDSFDLSDNDIRKVDGFPLLKRLHTLLLNNNRITRIGDHLEASLPNLETLILTNNNISELGDIDTLASVKTLQYISLLRNPIATKKHYRLYVIHKLPNLRLLDFQKIKKKERDAANVMFKGKKGQKLVKDISKKSFVPGAPVNLPGGSKSASAGDAPKPTMPRQDIDAIKRAIANATTLEEVERLNQILQSGHIPGQESLNGNQQEVEME
ncbi:hypothetical protein CAPTEDRAFT_229322 [Capitella teleta]|uniref:U2A'/phosphoprotein 32 family A C-terminal domain-containing protein n=1 Tax=Capitella teleta TaxID=283909 RepID=R7VM22_CAPTE|nr:hypothetical protein CAPTEDRAFT_229322 [Capitella teleta]|eukprot:ELU18761.1 hypothetical protein CAPTEDRAFT_229322 [Capitella teleta]